MATVIKDLNTRSVLEMILFDVEEFTEFYNNIQNVQAEQDKFIAKINDIWAKYPIDLWVNKQFLAKERKTLSEALTSVIKSSPNASIITGEKGLLEFVKTSIQGDIDPYEARDILLFLTWAILFLEQLEKQKIHFNKDEIIILRHALRDIIELSDENLLFTLLKYFGNLLCNHKESFLKSLEKMNKQRCFGFATVLQVIFDNSKKSNVDDKERAELANIRSILCNKLYREGVYHRSALLALVTLTKSNLNFGAKCKLLDQCHLSLNKQSNKAEHLKIWDMLRTLLLCNLKDAIEIFLSARAEKSFSFQELYWILFKETFKLKNEDESQYRQRFDHMHHHLLLGYRQNALEDIRPFFDRFIKAVLNEGDTGYQTLRYNNIDNPHLTTVFTGGSGNFLETLWCENPPVEKLEGGVLDGCHLRNTDNYWTLLTWGIGLNCLEPLEGKIYLIYHMLDGQNRLLLLTDKNNRPIAGCIFHLLFRGIDNPRPVLVLSPIYILIHHLKHVDAIRQALDNLATKTAVRMGLPLFAFHGGKVPDRAEARKLENSEPIYAMQGYVKGGFRTGIDELSSPINKREVNGALHYHNYQELYSPSIADLKLVAEQLKILKEKTLMFISNTKIGDEACSLVMGYLYKNFIDQARDQKRHIVQGHNVTQKF